MTRQPERTTVLKVYNQQRSVLGFCNERSGLGVVWSVPMNFPPSKVPDTTLVPCQMARMVAGNCHSHVSMGPQLPPVTPPPPLGRQIGFGAGSTSFDYENQNKIPIYR